MDAAAGAHKGVMTGREEEAARKSAVEEATSEAGEQGNCQNGKPKGEVRKRVAHDH